MAALGLQTFLARVRHSSPSPSPRTAVIDTFGRHVREVNRLGGASSGMWIRGIEFPLKGLLPQDMLSHAIHLYMMADAPWKRRVFAKTALVGSQVSTCLGSIRRNAARRNRREGFPLAWEVFLLQNLHRGRKDEKIRFSSSTRPRLITFHKSPSDRHHFCHITTKKYHSSNSFYADSKAPVYFLYPSIPASG